MDEPSCFYSPENVLEWRLNGILHRKDGPAQTHPDGSTKWFLNGVVHREDGPAIEASDGYKAWVVNGQYHREDGPAIIYPNGSLGWYIEGREIKTALVWIQKDPRYVRLMEIKAVYEVINQ
jgi:hypothetical protein